MYTLYHFPYSQHARRVHALLEECGLPYQLKHVDMGKGEHATEAYAQLNPNRQVPVLVDGEFVLAESNAILRYLCNKHDLSSWYPEVPAARARVDQWLDWNQARFGQAVVDIVLNQVFLGPRGDTEAIARGRRAVEKLAPILGRALEGREFIAGPAPTLADLSIASNITQLGLASAVPDIAALEQWYMRVLAIGGFARTLPPQ